MFVHKSQLCASFPNSTFSDIELIPGRRPGWNYFHYGNLQTLQIRDVYFFLVFSFFCSDWIIPVDLSLSSLALSSVISNLLLIPWSF